MKKKNLKKFILVSLIIFILVILLGTLIFWGVGNLIIWVFDINYKWTLLHGLVADIIWLLLCEIFKEW